MDHAIEFIQAESQAQVGQARELFVEYSEWLGLDLCFQNFQRELDELPGRYAPPEGRLLLSIFAQEVAGCGALRKIGAGICEMKRLYVRPDFRGKGIGRAIAQKLLEEARELGYERMRLDTLPAKMSGAIKVYRSLGFREIEPYYDNPVEGAMFMELELD